MSYDFDYINTNDKYSLKQVEEFLLSNNLILDPTVSQFVVFYDNNHKVIGCGGLSKDIIKCVAIDKNYRGQNLLLTLITEVIKLAYNNGYKELLVYTKADYEIIFKNCGFATIINSKDNFVFMENNRNGIKEYCKELAKSKVDGNKIASIVINANPFTLGHQYLLETAAAQSDWLHVFLVEEDLSYFNFNTRLELLKKGSSHIPNLTIHNSSKYIISRATFPVYFLKESNLIDQHYIELDLRVFKKYIAPSLGITHRFVGSEPYSLLTDQYNQAMKKILTNPTIEGNNIEVVQIDRKTINGQAISASIVRKLLQQQDFTELKKYLPSTTFDYLLEHYKK